MDNKIRVELRNVSKKFIKGDKNKNALETFINFVKGNPNNEEFWVLRDFFFKIHAGENVGIIGKNGSGKSTLLRVIAGIYRVDEGKVDTNGDLVYLTGFGYGLMEKLTMRENIFLSGSIMGLSQEAIREKFEDIVNFSGLREYLNVKLFKFSSGMKIRLASSIGLHCVSHKNPDILLVDEVIGGGADDDYQNKALKKMEQLLMGGASVVLVSHNMNAIKKYCDRVLWIENGKIVMRGKPSVVIDAYLNKTKYYSKILIEEYFSKIKNSTNSKIVLAGLPKSGTTAMIYKIKNSLDNVELFFEPQSALIDFDPDKTTLAKILIQRRINREVYYSLWKEFTKKILIIRDPRDIIISNLLYLIRHSNFYNDPEKVNQFISLLREKEKNPRIISLLKVFELYDELNGTVSNFKFVNCIKLDLDNVIRFHEENPDYFVIKYEDFIDKNLKDLENYLGFRLLGDSKVDSSLKRVSRTNSYGNWKDWFTEEDIHFFRPIFLEYLEKYSYNDDWKLSKDPKIPKKHCSEYVNMIIEEKVEEDKKI